jgi:radical SAM superfamily enzyme YgiQ (UPF0313 family)
MAGMRALLISTYDLGRQPFGLASAAAALVASGVDVTCLDLAKQKLDEAVVAACEVVAFYLPMHTAMRLALPVIDRVRQVDPSARLAAYGLYAPLSEGLLRARGVNHVFGPEAENELVELALARRRDAPPAAVRAGEAGRLGHGAPPLPRLSFIVPDRSGLPGAYRYAHLHMPDGSRRVVGATEATRGCKHRCRHCPIVPVYDGQFRVVSIDVVLADLDQQVAAGAEHITFGDPDFFNGPTHARRVVEALHARHPAVTYDVTIKVEHLLKHDDLLPVLARTGCLFVTSAVESFDDNVLAKLEKGHTRADSLEGLRLCRAAGITLVPTFVAFTPWTTLDGYRDLLATVQTLGLVEHVSPIQWGLRLLVTAGSRLLELGDIRRRVGSFDPQTLTYPWRHEDPRVDTLQGAIMREVGERLDRSRAELFALVCELAGLSVRNVPSWNVPDRATIPYLNEPWYC